MRMNARKVISLIIALVLVFSQVSVATAGTTDYSGHWAQTAIEKGIDFKIVGGYPNGDFKPEGKITRAEFVTMVNNVFQFQTKTAITYSDIKTADWFYDVVVKATSAGVMIGANNKFRPNDYITRQEAAVVLSRAFQMSAVNAKAYNTFSDASQVATWATSQMSAMIEAGYMSGRGNNILAPIANLTRAEAVTLMTNVAGDVVLTASTVTGNHSGNVVVNVANVILKDAVISGNLYITQGVGEGDFTLDNVKVTGEVVALGGGENSIHLINTQLGKLIVVKQGGKIRILAEGSTLVNQVDMLSGGKLEESGLTGDGFGDVEVFEVGEGEELTLDGDFDEVIIDTPIEITVTDGQVGQLTVTEDAEGTALNVGTTGTIGTLTLEASTEVTGTGTITSAVVKTEGSTLEIAPTNIEVVGTVTVVVAGNNITAINDTPVIPVIPGGTGGTPSNVNLTFELSSGSRNRPITVTAIPSASYTEIVRQILVAAVSEFDDIYTDYEADLLTNEGSFLIDAMTMFNYATVANLSGTIYSAVPLNVDGGVYTNLEKKATLQQALLITSNNYNNLVQVQADLTTIANRVNFSEIEFNGEKFNSVVITKTGVALPVASYTQLDGNKAAFIEALFTQLEALTMTSDVTYTMTVVLVDDSTRTSTLGTMN